ncbi:CBO0543 family protein [Bacillus infantis]|uniref:CBO0543 family protein n=1 Tax=Bacillus infantis TaxID=324767 RepID=UPI003CEC8D1B
MNKFEKNTLRFLLVFGLISFINLMRQPPVKDWMLIFLFKGYLSSVIDKLLVRKGYITYPVKLVKSFDVSFIFDYLLYPIACVYFNQATRTSGVIGILMKALCFSIPMALVEHFFEKRTSLIKFKKGWNSLISFYSLTITFLISRTFIAIIRKANNTPVPDNK